MRGTSQTLVLTGFEQIFRPNTIVRLSQIIWPDVKLAEFAVNKHRSANYPALSVFLQCIFFSIQVSHQLGNLMDLFTTFTSLAGGSIPTDRVIDGIDLSPALFENKTVDR